MSRSSPAIPPWQYQRSGTRRQQPEGSMRRGWCRGSCRRRWHVLLAGPGSWGGWLAWRRRAPAGRGGLGVGGGEGGAGGGGGRVVISAIGGMAGVGKTALAVLFTHRVAGLF